MTSELFQSTKSSNGRPKGEFCFSFSREEESESRPFDEKGCEIKVPAKILRFEDDLSEDQKKELFEESAMVNISSSLQLRKFDYDFALDLMEDKNEPLLDALEDSDLQSGRYEGGFKLWECSLDLVEYLEIELPSLISGMESENFDVLELGCGHGFPGIYSCLALEKIKNFKVVFQDYNWEVLAYMTRFNVALNLEPKGLLNSVEYISGDWRDTNLMCELSKVIDGRKFSLILTSETIYESTSLEALHDIIMELLDPSGIALIAAKRFYFGVGGGFVEFISLIERRGIFCHSFVKNYEDGVSNIRDILQLKLKASQ